MAAVSSHDSAAGHLRGGREERKRRDFGLCAGDSHRRRWRVEDATWGIKQRFCLERFLVRSRRSIRRLLCLVAWAFFCLNLHGWRNTSRFARPFLSIPGDYPKGSRTCSTGWPRKSADSCTPDPDFRPTANSAVCERQECIGCLLALYREHRLDAASMSPFYRHYRRGPEGRGRQMGHLRERAIDMGERTIPKAGKAPCAKVG